MQCQSVREAVHNNNFSLWFIHICGRAKVRKVQVNEANKFRGKASHVVELGGGGVMITGSELQKGVGGVARAVTRAFNVDVPLAVHRRGGGGEHQISNSNKFYTSRACQLSPAVVKC